ncbi:MAG: RNA polymerase sigma factor [Fimbriimonas sp.]
MAALIPPLDVQQAATGDREAFARLLDATRTTVCSIALAVVRDVEASEDVAQDVYVHVWRDLPRLRNPDSFLPWLRQLARNRAHAFLRRDMPSRRTGLGDLEATLRDPGATAEEALLDEAHRRALRDGLDALSADAREVLILFYREEQSVRQVAGLLELSESAVKKRLERAREALRDALLQGASEAIASTKPGANFSLAVLALLPPLSPGTQTLGKGALLAAGVGKAASTYGSAFLSGSLGAAGLVAGYLRLLRQAETEEERRNLKRLAFGGVSLLFVQAFAVTPLMLRWPRPEVLVGWYASVVLTLAVQLFVIVPRITAARLAAERERDPSAAARQRRQWRLGFLWFAIGVLLGGAGVVAALMKSSLF